MTNDEVKEIKEEIDLLLFRFDKLDEDSDLAQTKENAKVLREKFDKLIFEYEEEYNKAFDNYLNASSGKSLATQFSWRHLMELGNKLNRTKEVIEHYQKMMPDLFQKNPIIYWPTPSAAPTSRG